MPPCKFLRLSRYKIEIIDVTRIFLIFWLVKKCKAKYPTNAEAWTSYIKTSDKSDDRWQKNEEAALQKTQQGTKTFPCWEGLLPLMGFCPLREETLPSAQSHHHLSLSLQMWLFFVEGIQLLWEQILCWLLKSLSCCLMTLRTLETFRMPFASPSYPMPVKTAPPDWNPKQECPGNCYFLIIE